MSSCVCISQRRSRPPKLVVFAVYQYDTTLSVLMHLPFLLYCCPNTREPIQEDACEAAMHEGMPVDHPLIDRVRECSTTQMLPRFSSACCSSSSQRSVFCMMLHATPTSVPPLTRQRQLPPYPWIRAQTWLKVRCPVLVCLWTMPYILQHELHTCMSRGTKIECLLERNSLLQ